MAKKGQFLNAGRAHFYRETNPLLEIKGFILLLITSFLFFGCIDNQPNNRSRSQASLSETPSQDAAAPDFSNQLNFIQNGSQQSSSSLLINIDLKDYLYMRGKQIDEYLRSKSANEVLCLISHHPSSQANQILVSAMTPQSFYNFSTQRKEYYFLINMTEDQTTKGFCQKAGLMASLDQSYPDASIAWKLSDLCSTPNCISSQYQGEGLIIKSTTGQTVDNISTHYLSFRIANRSTPPQGSTSCQASSECKAIGFDCCSDGVCVKDLELKAGATNDPEYENAMEEIMANPLAIYDYPNLYHICNVAPIKPPEPQPDFDADGDASLRFLEKKELYECTNPIEGEMSVCTVVYENVSAKREQGITVFETLGDDRNFIAKQSGSNLLPPHSIYEVTYAGRVFYENGQAIITNTDQFDILEGNDNLSDTQQIHLDFTPSTSAPNDTLRIRYKIDGSCQRVNNQMARCEVHYNQGQDLGKVDDKAPASNNFRLPTYADTNRTIQVFVDNEVRLQGTDWELVPSNPPEIRFPGNDLQVYDSQEVVIAFFVNTQSFNVLQSRQKAINRINELCGCTNNVQCGLKTRKDGSGNIEDYICDYPEPLTPEPPQQQTILLSSKATAHRFFDASGAYRASINGYTDPQEGRQFRYINNDLLKPNNIDEYVGFNEIYGSYTTSPGSAQPARLVEVKPGKTYDIYVDDGSFNTCSFCGNDYYSNLARIFPNNFQNPGGGYTPHPSATNKMSPGDIRADDLIFGRACFIPATMIPWSHNPNADRQQQRLRRLEAQHFLFANGYQRDWYGFDYGSVIGSFDGVSWFSIGSQRRVQAKTNKLFIAINAYFGDLTNNTTYRVSVNETTGTSFASDNVTRDIDSDGAQCRRYHMCNTDTDCATTLGWEYSCENVSNIRSKWPVFDLNAQEIPGVLYEDRLINIFNMNDSGPRRCVYRGRGAPCVPDFKNATESSSYTRTSGEENPGLHACTSNQYCQRITEGVPMPYFNNRISRFGKSVRHQNASPDIDEDDLNEFGVGARIIGRPYNYIGEEIILTEALQGLSSNNVQALCLPGRDPNASSLFASNRNRPQSSLMGDQVNRMGMTLSTGTSIQYLNSCPVFRNDNYIYKHPDATGTTSMSSPAITNRAVRQNISTNALKIFESPDFAGQRLLKDFENEHIESIAYQENRCLRAPGSACHTNMDCAPNSFIESRLNNIIFDIGTTDQLMNRYEVEFWQQGLVCSQDLRPDEDGFDIKNNRCCRENRKEITVGTLIDQSGFFTRNPEYPNFNPISIPGVDIPYSDSRRYSRNATVADLMGDPNYPPLVSARRNNCGSSQDTCLSFENEIRNQWRTLSAMNERTCCSGHWIRNFHEDNGGGYNWAASKHQNIDKRGFRCYNWTQCNGACPASEQFTCGHTNAPDDPSCLIRATTNSQARPIFEFLGKLELTGIPQIGLPSVTASTTGPLKCSADPTDQNDPGESLLTTHEGNPLVRGLDIGETIFGEFDNLENKFAAHDENNFDESLKMIFSKDKFSCCLPAGTRLDPGANPSECCTGFINEQTGRCALPDYTNVSVYFNRYVSSAAKDLNESLINPDTGYINSASIVEQLACFQQVCASGVLARGIVLSNQKVPGHESEAEEYRIRRFLEQNNDPLGLASLYDEGLKWNEHVYCVPEELSEVAGGEVTIFPCAVNFQE